MASEPAQVATAVQVAGAFNPGVAVNPVVTVDVVNTDMPVNMGVAVTVPAQTEEDVVNAAVLGPQQPPRIPQGADSIPAEASEGEGPQHTSESAAGDTPGKTIGAEAGKVTPPLEGVEGMDSVVESLAEALESAEAGQAFQPTEGEECAVAEEVPAMEERPPAEGESAAGEACRRNTGVEETDRPVVLPHHSAETAARAKHIMQVMKVTPQARIAMWNKKNQQRMLGYAAPMVAKLDEFLQDNPDVDFYLGQGMGHQHQVAAVEKLNKILQMPSGVGSCPSTLPLPTPPPATSSRPLPALSSQAPAHPPGYPAAAVDESSERRSSAAQIANRTDRAVRSASVGAATSTSRVRTQKDLSCDDQELKPVYGKNTATLIMQINALVEYYKVFPRRFDCNELWRGNQEMTKGDKLGHSLRGWLEKMGVEAEFREPLIVDTLAHIRASWSSTEGIAVRERVKRPMAWK